MIRKLKILLSKLIPRIHNLPQIIYINWLGYEWYITKHWIEILFGFISFQGLPFEKVIVIIIKSMILNKRKLTARESMRMRRKLRKRNCRRRLWKKDIIIT